MEVYTALVNVCEVGINIAKKNRVNMPRNHSINFGDILRLVK